MIGVLAQGRLGNQMFQFAFAYSLANTLNTSFFIQGQDSLHYFKLYNGFSFKNGFRKFVSQFSVKYKTDWPNQLGGNDYLLKKMENNTFYTGYFQSEEYFKKYKKEIINLFEVKEEHRNGFKTFQKKIKNDKYIAIHIRRGDYLSHGDDSLGGKDISLPMSYYKNCLSTVPNSENYKVVFVSDDIDFVKKEFGSASNYLYERNDEITDFQILQNAEILITANSTFSWWAAWLNPVPNKKVYAPKYFLGIKVNQYYPAGINTPDWEWVDVN